MKVRTLFAGAAVALLCFTLTACSKVKGNTYEAGMMALSFQSGGKATFSAAGDAASCTYTESGNTVTVICGGDTTVFTVDGDGNLAGPPGSLMGKLIKRKS